MVIINKIQQYFENRKLSSNPLVAELQRALSRDRVLEEEEDRLLHSKDESVFEGGNFEKANFLKFVQFFRIFCTPESYLTPPVN